MTCCHLDVKAGLCRQLLNHTEAVKMERTVTDSPASQLARKQLGSRKSHSIDCQEICYQAQRPESYDILVTLQGTTAWTKT